jgi:hypothetical protein
MGTVIQTFGRHFVNNINFYMSDKPYKTVSDSSYNFNITGVSPFSICGTPDNELMKYASCERTNMRVKTDVLKNLDELIQNAHADYFVIDNTCALIGLWKINGQLYSLMGGEKTDFMDDFFNNNPEIKNNYIKPFVTGFTDEFRKQYDLFIETIMRYYDSDHIILVNSHEPQFCIDKENIRLVIHSSSINHRRLLRELDEYFALKTNCAVINTAESFFPLPDWSFGARFNFALEGEIISVCETEPEFRKRINSTDIQNPRKRIRKDRLTVILRDEIVNLKQYWGDNYRTIADYIAELKEVQPDFSLIISYFRYIDYTFDDIVALFWLYEKTQDKTPFKDIGLEILQNKNGDAYLYTKELFDKNKKLLSEYEYCMIEKVPEISFKDQIVMRFSDRVYLKITSGGDFEMIKLPPCKSWNWDYKKFIENGSTCGIDEIEDALSSCALYFERARTNDLSPLKLRFDNINEFSDTFYYIEYTEILNNENYCITLPESIEPKNYKPKVDLTFLFDKKTRIILFSNGFGDQIQYYGYSKIISKEYSNYELYFYDLIFDYNYAFNGIEIQNFAGKEIIESEKRRFFRNIFSKKMRLQYKKKIFENDYGLRDSPVVLYLLGLIETFIIYDRFTFNVIGQRTKKPSASGIPIPPCRFMVWDNIRILPYQITIDEVSVIFITSFVSTMSYKVEYKKFWEDICNFPMITDEKNLEIKEKMLSTDAYVLHVRRGDYVRLNWQKDNDFFRKRIEMAFLIQEYTKKHLFVFSDDINWVCENAENISINLFGENVTYVNHNHHYDSFRDIQLMTYGKVIIPSGNSAFSGVAATVSKRVEYIFGGRIITDNPIFKDKLFIKRKKLPDGTPTCEFTAE